MWRRLDELLKFIPEDKWKHFRKHRFKVRFVNDASTFAKEHVDKYDGKFRLGMLSGHQGWPGHSVNIVPLKQPGSWTTTDVAHIEVYISPKDYIEKLAPIVLSQ
jgi:hypothetical protein